MGVTLVRPARKDEASHPGQGFLKPFRQIIESVNHTLKAQLDLELPGGRAPGGVIARAWQHMLALTAVTCQTRTPTSPCRGPSLPTTTELTPWN
ncbi:MAG: hypothetical protein ACP5VR_06285 [Acidimicrobiales bacterium]